MSTYLIFLIIFIITFVLGIFLMPYVASISKELHIFDLPDSRKVHKQPIPRTGGLTFLPVATIAIALILILMLRFGYDETVMWKGSSIQHFLAYLSGAMMLFAIGMYDDIHGVGYKVKFVVQIMSSMLLCLSGLWVATLGHVFMIDEIPFWIGMPFTIGVVVYITNAMNLIDGIDGLASGLSAISFAVIAFLNIISLDFVWALIPVAFLGVVLSFFYYNVFNKEHKLFMGDAGSLTLGYTLSFLILHFWQREPVWNIHLHNIGIIAVSTLVIPMFDVIRVFASRVRDGRNPFLPDKNHIHHKLLRAGLDGKMTMIVILLLSCMFITLNYFVAAYISQTMIVVLDVALFILMHIVINIFILKKEKINGITWDRVL